MAEISPFGRDDNRTVFRLSLSFRPLLAVISTFSCHFDRREKSHANNAWKFSVMDGLDRVVGWYWGKLN